MQRLKVDVPVVLYRHIGDRINVRYSRLYPRIALLEGEEESSQMIDARQYPGGSYGDYSPGEYNAGIIGFGLFSLIGIGLFIFGQELTGKIVGIGVMVFCWSIVWYLITVDSRAQRK